MNKKTLSLTIGVIILAIAGYMTYMFFSTKPLSPVQSVTHSYNGLDMKVDYCSPSKRGRVIFGDSQDALVPYGKFWRLGANEATEITFSKDVSIMGKPLKAGTYRMYAVPSDSSWEISFNSELGKWGANTPDYTLDVLKVVAPAEKGTAVTESFTISFSNDASGVNMNLDWDTTRVRVAIAMN